VSELKGLYISDALHKKIKELAAREGATIRAVVERVLTEELKKTRGQGNGRDQDQEHDLGGDRQPR